jgi:CBS domain-containing protein
MSPGTHLTTHSPASDSDTASSFDLYAVYHTKAYADCQQRTAFRDHIGRGHHYQPIDEAIGSFSLGLNKAFVHDTDHLFEVMSVMADHKLSAVPVVDFKGNYVGLITLEDLIQFYARSFSFSEPGGIIVIEMTKVDYSLAEISRVIESEHATVLSSFLTHDEESKKMFVTLKTNQVDTKHLQATLERFGYNIKATFSEEGYFESLQDHYEAFLHYLNV